MATALLATLVLAGCSAQGTPQGATERPADTGTAQPPGGRSAAAAPGWTFRLPMAVYSYTADEYATIEAAEQVLAKRCMAGYSLSYRPPERTAVAPGVDRRYGLSEQDAALAPGYRLPPSQPPAEAGDLSKEQISVLYGRRGSEGRTGPLEYRGKAIPEEGCLGQSILDFRKDYEHPQAVEAARRISTQSYQDSMARPEIQAAFQKWSACMKEKGYTYASPMDPPSVGKFQEGPVTAEEKATAEADVACKRRTDLLNSWFAVESEIQQAMIAGDAAVLQELRELHRKKVAAARAVLTEG
ncbi:MULTISPECIES: hypothetical protein [unclassified Streptomyces]|uniref:hypothetical protein n=1 Tax=unclassified Streptomyces TaxID=2593676 RepID=UPI00131C9F56|nr:MULTISPECIES: hypothetical protein [unclassified Streptomyces]